MKQRPNYMWIIILIIFLIIIISSRNNNYLVLKGGGNGSIESENNSIDSGISSILSKILATIYLTKNIDRLKSTVDNYCDSIGKTMNVTNIKKYLIAIKNTYGYTRSGSPLCDYYSCSDSNLLHAKYDPDIIKFLELLREKIFRCNKNDKNDPLSLCYYKMEEKEFDDFIKYISGIDESEIDRISRKLYMNVISVCKNSGSIMNEAIYDIIRKKIVNKI